MTRNLSEADALDGLGSAVDIDMDQEMVENIEHAEASLGSGIVDRLTDSEMTPGEPGEDVDFQITQNSAEHAQITKCLHSDGVNARTCADFPAPCALT